MKTPDHRGLWRDALAEGLDSTFEAASLARTLACARQVRRGRRIVKIAAASAVGLLVSGAFFYGLERPAKPAKLSTAKVQRSSTPIVAPTGPAARKIHFLTDEELFSRFPNRAVALIGPPGHEELVFLENAPRDQVRQ